MATTLNRRFLSTCDIKKLLNYGITVRITTQKGKKREETSHSGSGADCAVKKMAESSPPSPC